MFLKTVINLTRYPVQANRINIRANPKENRLFSSLIQPFSADSRHLNYCLLMVQNWHK
jgi:hypothetical protein